MYRVRLEAIVASLEKVGNDEVKLMLFIMLLVRLTKVM